MSISPDPVRIEGETPAWGRRHVEGNPNEAVPAQRLPARWSRTGSRGPGTDHERRLRRPRRDEGRGRVGVFGRPAPGEHRHGRPRQGRRGLADRRPVRRGQRAHRRVLDHPGGRPRRRAGVGAQAGARHDAADRSAADARRDHALTFRMPGVSTSDIEQVFRQEYGRAVAVLVRVFGDIDIAEEAVQDAFTAAVQRWPSSGLPPSPAGWIITTARNRAIDRLRRESVRDDRYAQAALLHAHDEPAADTEEDVVRDERLRLIFTCCHPALAPAAQVALTLRLLGGLTTAEIARAFLVPEATMAQRLVRAKGKIRDAG